MPIPGEGSGKLSEPQYMGRVQVAYGKYSFAVLGGAQGQITLTGDTIPSGADVIDVVMKVSTAPTSGGAATISLDMNAAADLNAADAISGAPWSSLATVRLDALDATKAPIRLTAARQIKCTIGTADLTAGVFEVMVSFIEW